MKRETLNAGASTGGAVVTARPSAPAKSAANQPAIENYFVCVGAQKSGTTWLARVLADHPDVFVTPVKEIHYFDHVRGLTEHLSAKKSRSRYDIPSTYDRASFTESLKKILESLEGADAPRD